MYNNANRMNGKKPEYIIHLYVFDSETWRLRNTYTYLDVSKMARNTYRIQLDCTESKFVYKNFSLIIVTNSPLDKNSS